jgi:hypothetical protein
MNGAPLIGRLSTLAAALALVPGCGTSGTDFPPLGPITRVLTHYESFDGEFFVTDARRLSRLRALIDADRLHWATSDFHPFTPAATPNHIFWLYDGKRPVGFFRVTCSDSVSQYRSATGVEGYRKDPQLADALEALIPPHHGPDQPCANQR